MGGWEKGGVERGRREGGREVAVECREGVGGVGTLLEGLREVWGG